VSAGVTRAVVNVHAFADALEAHLRGRTDAEILISDEREQLLETGGGLKAARSLLGDDPILVANIDSLWLDDDAALGRLAADWDGARMDALHLLAPLERSTGFHGAGDFFRAPDGTLTHRGNAEHAPFAQAGVHLLDPMAIDRWPEGAFSAFPRWLEMADRGRLYGVPLKGLWMHVGDPGAHVDQRSAGHLDQGLRAIVGERTHARAQSRREHHGRGRRSHPRASGGKWRASQDSRPTGPPSRNTASR